MPENENTSDIAALTVRLLSAYLSNNVVASENLAGLIRSTRAALIEEPAAARAEAVAAPPTPAVSVRKSLASPEHILSLIDGKPYKTLKRHLATHGLTPETYRERFGLPANYPMVAPNFVARRREIAKAIGLGSNRQAADPGKPSAVEATTEAVATESGATGGEPAKAVAEAAPKVAVAKAAVSNPKRTARAAKPAPLAVPVEENDAVRASAQSADSDGAKEKPVKARTAPSKAADPGAAKPSPRSPKGTDAKAKTAVAARAKPKAADKVSAELGNQPASASDKAAEPGSGLASEARPRRRTGKLALFQGLGEATKAGEGAAPPAAPALSEQESGGPESAVASPPKPKAAPRPRRTGRPPAAKGEAKPA